MTPHNPKGWHTHDLYHVYNQTFLPIFNMFNLYEHDPTQSLSYPSLYVSNHMKPLAFPVFPANINPGQENEEKNKYKFTTSIMCTMNCIYIYIYIYHIYHAVYWIR